MLGTNTDKIPRSATFLGKVAARIRGPCCVSRSDSEMSVPSYSRVERAKLAIIIRCHWPTRFFGVAVVRVTGIRTLRDILDHQPSATRVVGSYCCKGLGTHLRHDGHSDSPLSLGMEIYPGDRTEDLVEADVVEAIKACT